MSDEEPMTEEDRIAEARRRSSLHDIVQRLMMGRLHAEWMATGWPHHAGTLNKFIADCGELQRQLVNQLRREGLYGREPVEPDDGDAAALE